MSAHDYGAGDQRPQKRGPKRDADVPTVVRPPLDEWRAICEDAPATIMEGRKYLMLSEEACVRLGTALERAHGMPACVHGELRKPLSIDQSNALPEAKGWWPVGTNDRIVRLIRAVERAHGVDSVDGRKG